MEPPPTRHSERAQRVEESSHVAIHDRTNILWNRQQSPLALPLGELSPQVTERALQRFGNDNIYWYPQCFPSPSSLRSATSPIGRGKGGACQDGVVPFNHTGCVRYGASPSPGLAPWDATDTNVPQFRLTPVGGRLPPLQWGYHVGG